MLYKGFLINVIPCKVCFDNLFKCLVDGETTMYFSDKNKFREWLSSDKEKKNAINDMILDARRAQLRSMGMSAAQIEDIFARAARYADFSWSRTK